MPQLTELEKRYNVAAIVRAGDLSPVARGLASYVGDFDNIPELRRKLHLDYDAGRNLSTLVEAGELDAWDAVNMLAAELILMEETLELKRGVRIFVETTPSNVDYASQLLIYESTAPLQRTFVDIYSKQLVDLLNNLKSNSSQK